MKTAKELKETTTMHPEFTLVKGDELKIITTTTFVRIKIDGVWKLFEFRCDSRCGENHWNDEDSMNETIREDMRRLNDIIKFFKKGESDYPKGEKIKNFEEGGIIDDNQED